MKTRPAWLYLPSSLSAFFLFHPSFHYTYPFLSLNDRGECQAFPGTVRWNHVLKTHRTRFLELVTWGTRGRQGWCQSTQAVTCTFLPPALLPWSCCLSHLLFPFSSYLFNRYLSSAEHIWQHTQYQVHATCQAPCWALEHSSGQTDMVPTLSEFCGK